MMLKFTQDGKFLMQIGKPVQSKGSNDPENLKAAAKKFIDPKTNEVYVADGYGNHRVIVFDADTGNTSGTGALTAISRTTPIWAPTIPTRSARAAVSQSRSLRRTLP